MVSPLLLIVTTCKAAAPLVHVSLLFEGFQFQSTVYDLHLFGDGSSRV